MASNPLRRKTAAAVTFFVVLTTCLTRKTAADEPPELRLLRDLTFMQLEEQKWGTYTIRYHGVKEARAAMITRRKEQEARRVWLDAEKRAFTRLAGEVEEELDTAIRSRSNLRAAAAEATQFANGNGWRAKRAEFIQLLRHVGHADEVRSHLKEEAPTLPADDFQGHQYADIVYANGRLAQPPRALLSDSQNKAGQQIFRDLRMVWNDCVADLKQGAPIPDARLQAMQQLAERWNEVSGLSRGLPNPATTEYLDRIDRLIGAIRDDETRASVERFFTDGGHAFSGGTVGDLVRHVLVHDLVVTVGTPGHLAMAGLTRTMVDEARKEIALLDERIEKYKAQSPALDAVLRQRMEPSNPKLLNRPADR